MATEKAKQCRPPRLPQSGVAPRNMSALPLASKGGDHMCLQALKRDSVYLEYVRTRPCSFCRRVPCKPHHVFKQFRGISTAALSRKGSDYLAIAVCRECHEKIHTGSFRPSHVDLLELIVIHLACFVDKNAARLSVPVTRD